MIKKYWSYIVILILIVCWFQTCQNKNSTISDLKAKSSIDSLDFVVQKTKDGKLIASQEVKIIGDGNTMKKLVGNNEYLRNINRQVKVTTHTLATNLKAEPTTPVKVIHDTVTIDNTKKITHFLKLPQSFAYTNKWIDIQYSIDTLGESIIDTALFINKPKMTFGDKKENFVKRLFTSPTATVTFEDENKYTKVKGLQSLEYKPKPKLYQRKGVWGVAGIVLGFVLKKKI